MFFARTITKIDSAEITPKEPSQSSETNSTNNNRAGKSIPPITPNTIKDSIFEFNHEIYQNIAYNIGIIFWLVPKEKKRKFLIYDKNKTGIELVLVDKKILTAGLAMIVVGIIITFAYSEQPIGQAGMSEDEIIELMIAEDQNQAYQMLSGILIGVGFLLVLISFGARRKKDSVKRKEKKPAE